MEKTITAAQMRALEKRAFEQTDETSLSLMERAARAVCQSALEYPTKRALFLLGAGNNGADGLAAARLYRASGREAIVWRLSGRLSVENQAQERLWGAPVTTYAPPMAFPEGIGLIVDALFGIGLSRPLDGDARALIDQINESSLPVLSVDVPSGLDADKGLTFGACVKATETVTFHRIKQGLLLGQGLDFAGRLTLRGIGIPKELDDAPGLSVLLPNDLTGILKARRRDTHKGEYGRVTLICGSYGMAGAAAISALAALKAGAGLVTVVCPPEILSTVQTLCPCATCRADWDEALLDRSDALAIGCGLGRSEEAQERLCALLRYLEKTDKPCVLDADALNLIAELPEKPRLTQNQLMTPHPMEAARLKHCDVPSITDDPVSAARALVSAYGCAALVKGAVTAMATKDDAALNIIGTPAMAKGGSGDALTGILVTLLAQKVAGPLYTMQLGCCLHGLAGRRAAAYHGENGLLATELCEQLGRLSRESARILGKTVTVTMDRPLGSVHPRNPKIVYTANYGYIAGVPADDGAWQDAYVLGVDTPLATFTGVVIAVIHRLDDTEDKWIVAPEGAKLTARDVWEQTKFVEQFFVGKIEML